MHNPSFITTTRGLDRAALPMRLFEKAKRLGIWNPADIDLTQDRADWHSFSALEQEVLLHLTTLFQGGEEAVTLDLLPLIMIVAREGRLEEELFLTSFLWEEAKHVDFFRRFLDEVAGNPPNLTRFESPAYRLLFHDRLPAALHALLADPSPAAQMRAAVTYNIIVEGVLAETGYHGFFTALSARDVLPGVRAGIGKLKQDESRHIAYGLYLIGRLLAADAGLWAVAQATLNDLLPLALGVIGDIFSRYEVMPFALDLPTFANYALLQYQQRLARLEAARDGAALLVEEGEGGLGD